jgi:hypothetical protein
MLRNFIRHAALVLGFAALAGTAAAQTVPAPADQTILTVTGAIAVSNVGDTLQFDRAALEALDTTTIKTSTIWTDGVHVFQGVSLKVLTDLLGVTSGTILATAINDYTIEIPVSDAVTGGPVIAYLMDGEPMSVREKGPLWVVYPYDSNGDYRSEVVYSRSIWQLDRLEIVQ